MGVFFVEQKGYFHRKKDNEIQESSSLIKMNVFECIFE
jgi:hypothetical protein